MSDNGITRARYFEQQFLRTQDFVVEQAYHVAMRRRHNVGHHTWGIVRGLELVAEEGSFYVQPGVAVDGYGRELVLPQRQPLDPRTFDDRGGNELDVWLLYVREGSDAAPAGYAGCGASGGPAYYRWTETARVRLTKPDPDFITRDPAISARRQPEQVPDADLKFSPSGTPPEDAQWPVFLGQIARDPADPARLSVKLDDRPYVGLVGEQVVAPSGLGRVQVGAERAEDENRFAVFVKEDGAASVSRVPQLSIDRRGALSVRRDANLYGNLTLAGGAIEFEAGGARDPAMPSWCVYHTELGSGAHELRVEMPSSGTGRNSVVIGAWFKGLDDAGNEKEEFHPCLTVADDCKVTVHGDLVVVGHLVETQPRMGGQFTAAAQSLMTSAFFTGFSGQTAGGGAQTLKEAPSLLRESETTSGDADLKALMLRLDADPERLAKFAELIKTNPELAEKLRGALTDIVKPDAPP